MCDARSQTQENDFFELSRLDGFQPLHPRLQGRDKFALFRSLDRTSVIRRVGTVLRSSNPGSHSTCRALRQSVKSMGVSFATRRSLRMNAAHDASVVNGARSRARYHVALITVF